MAASRRPSLVRFRKYEANTQNDNAGKPVQEMAGTQISIDKGMDDFSCDAELAYVKEKRRKNGMLDCFDFGRGVHPRDVTFCDRMAEGCRTEA
ncbi:hypothetical protein SERLA73DRAFT_76194 [Serpula lacrymans var. lacrymans S7.3]|uniref:Uncharacterized protein n=1 Tax=Serpula lacrymans var. lacrymans (strain S7.3) TaxID=936435 RepID=F8Q6H5_SERL3|nr:hypothetical protein SERLA73DRAFT_76194 [Serpula lacrymans var. lacrymans S7.3]